MSEAEILDVLDASGRVVGSKSRSAVHQGDDWHGLVFVWGAWTSGDGTTLTLLQRRGADGDPFSGCADALGSGHMLSGQSAAEAAAQELAEEAGLRVAESDLDLFESVARDRPGSSCRRTFQYHFLLRRSLSRTQVEYTAEVDGYFLVSLVDLGLLLDQDATSVPAQLWTNQGEAAIRMTRDHFAFPPPVVDGFRASVGALYTLLRRKG